MAGKNVTNHEKLSVFLYVVSSFLDEITASFRRFGHLFVDWPHKAESKSYFPPKGLWNFFYILKY